MTGKPSPIQYSLLANQAQSNAHCLLWEYHCYWWLFQTPKLMEKFHVFILQPRTKHRWLELELRNSPICRFRFGRKDNLLGWQMTDLSRKCKNIENHHKVEKQKLFQNLILASFVFHFFSGN